MLNKWYQLNWILKKKINLYLRIENTVRNQTMIIAMLRNWDESLKDISLFDIEQLLNRSIKRDSYIIEYAQKNTHEIKCQSILSKNWWFHKKYWGDYDSYFEATLYLILSHLLLKIFFINEKCTFNAWKNLYLFNELTKIHVLRSNY